MSTLCPQLSMSAFYPQNSNIAVCTIPREMSSMCSLFIVHSCPCPHFVHWIRTHLICPCTLFVRSIRTYANLARPREDKFVQSLSMSAFCPLYSNLAVCAIPRNVHSLSTVVHVRFLSAPLGFSLPPDARLDLSTHCPHALLIANITVTHR